MSEDSVERITPGSEPGSSNLGATEERASAATVLIVDDDDLVRNAHQRFLVRWGMQVFSASSACAALALLDDPSIQIDVVLTDLVMPGMDGVTLLREIRRRGLEIPVLLITGSPRLESAVDTINSGGFRYLVKPVALDELLISVRAATSLFRLGKLKQQALALMHRHRQELSDRAGLERHFANALARLWMAFQPIVDCRTRSLVGYEALVRTSSPALPNPGALLDAAERLECVHVLGRQIRQLVSTRMPEAPADSLFFVNLHPSDLNDEELFSPSAPLTQVASRVMLEITERHTLDAVTDLTRKLDTLRSLGFRIAVDDLGAGYAGLSSFTQINPDLVKLDMSLIRCIEHSDQQQSIVRSMITVCRQELNVQVVCEGVETLAEHETLERLGATLLQGYLLGRPSPTFEIPNWDAIQSA